MLNNHFTRNGFNKKIFVIVYQNELDSSTAYLCAWTIIFTFVILVACLLWTIRVSCFLCYKINWQFNKWVIVTTGRECFTLFEKSKFKCVVREQQQQHRPNETPTWRSRQHVWYSRTREERRLRRTSRRGTKAR